MRSTEFSTWQLLLEVTYSALRCRTEWWTQLVLKVRNEALGFCSEPVHRCRRCDVKRVVLRIAPSQIGRLFGHHDCAQVISVCVPHPDALRACHEEIAFVIHFDSVWNAFTLSSRLFAEDSAMSECSVGRHVVDADISLLVIVYVELLAIGPDNDIVRAIETFSFVPIGEHFVFSVRSYFDNGSQHARTVNQTVAAVESISVRITQRDDFLFSAVRI